MLVGDTILWNNPGNDFCEPTWTHTCFKESILARGICYYSCFCRVGSPCICCGEVTHRARRTSAGRCDRRIERFGCLRERVEKAAELYKEGLAPRIILTNDNQQGSWDNAQQRNPFFFEKSFDELVSRNVPKDAIEVLKTPVSSTHDEAQIVESYGRQHQFGSIMIITSDYHSRRALWTFHRVIGKGQISVGVEPVISTSPWSWWLHLSGWKSIPVELVKFVYYRLVH